jgi:hypothetical protein
MNKYIDSVLFPDNSPYTQALREKDQADHNANLTIKDHLHHSFGGCWKFNEIIGYIRLHFLGTQIRGEYFGVKKKRIVKTRTKTLEYRTWKLAPEIEVPDEATDSDIFTFVMEYIADCKKELPRRHIDTELLEAMGPYVRWRELYDNAQPCALVNCDVGLEWTHKYDK